MPNLSHDQALQLLASVETIRLKQGISRHELAGRLGIPFETLRRWFRKAIPRLPSPDHLSQLASFVASTSEEAAGWSDTWEGVKRWWTTQHRYGSVAELARDLGWDVDQLRDCLSGNLQPPRLVLERLGKLLNIRTPVSAPNVAEARKRSARLRCLLTLLNDELSWFRDGPEELRTVFRSELNPFDVGYLSSLLAMLGDEAKFKRWLSFTTNRFGTFQEERTAPMTREILIQLAVGSALRWLGTVYRNPADAIKEHISNAIDEHLRAQKDGQAVSQCEVVFTLARKSIVVEYPYGMNRREFEAALARVADSAKKGSDVSQIGRLGIGIFSFQQIGRKCTFLSRKSADGETIRVVLTEGSDKAGFDTALKHEALPMPGIRIEITQLKLDPTKPRGPLAPERLQQIFAEKFDGHLRKGWLRILIRCGDREYNVTTLPIDLPRLGKGIEVLRIPGQPNKTIALSLYFDSAGKGMVSIRHMGVAVVEDLRALSAYGLEDSVYARGFVRGFIDADFLEPLPARTGFEESPDWIACLDLLDKNRPQIEAEVELLKQEEREKALSEVQRTAIRLAKEILDSEEFRSLELPGGITRTKAPADRTITVPTGRRTGERSDESGDRHHPSGLRINYVERPFETGQTRHSRFVGGEVQANVLNPDFKRETAGTDEVKLAYITLLIGKEVIAFNDKAGIADDFLEWLLTFYFRAKDRISPRSPVPGKRGPGRPRKLLSNS